jgi:hypothetical protein
MIVKGDVQAKGSNRFVLEDVIKSSYLAINPAGV